MNPSNVSKWVVKAQQANTEQKYLDAIKHCRKAIKMDQQNIPAHQLLSIALTKLCRYHEATPIIKSAILLNKNGNNTTLLHLLGCNYIYTEQYSMSLNILEKEFHQTGNLNILLDIGLNLAEQGAYHDARNIYLKLLKQQPDNHQAQFNLYSIMLYFHNFTHAWFLFHSRLQRQDLQQEVQWLSKQWEGESLHNKNILVWSEQGVGDNLLYSSCLAEAIQDAQQVLVVCDERCIRLFQDNFPQATFLSIRQINQQRALPFPLDLQILAGSLTYLYRQQHADFSRQQSLRISASVLSQNMQQWENNKLKVGISWFHGRINNGNRYSMPLAQLLPLFALPNIEWVNLQFGEYHKELAALEQRHNLHIHNFKSNQAKDDFANYGALISQLDIVIAPSNATFMFAARLGIESWLFTPKPDVLLGPDPTQSPWFENVKQFCKPLGEDWKKVIDKMVLQLQKRVKDRHF